MPTHENAESEVYSLSLQCENSSELKNNKVMDL